MEDHLKVDFAKRLGYGAKPGDLPERYSELFDKLGLKTYAMHRGRLPDRRDWPMLVLLTDVIDKQRETNEALEARIKALESVNKPHMTLVVEDGEPDPTIVDVPETPVKEHWKTKRARELREAVGA